MALRKQRKQCEQRHHCHVLEQENGEGALTVGLLELTALFEDLKRDCCCGHGERESGDNGATPAEQAKAMGEKCNYQCGERQLGGAEAEDRAAHGHQLAEFELEPDDEQEQHHAQFGHRNDALGRWEYRERGWADDHSADQIGHDGRKPDPACNRHAEDHGRQEYQPEGQEIEFAESLCHDSRSFCDPEQTEAHQHRISNRCILAVAPFRIRTVLNYEGNDRKVFEVHTLRGA